MNKEKIILIGAGGHAHACLDVVEQHGRFNIAGFVDKTENLHTNYFGYSVIATDNDLSTLIHDTPYALVAIGQIQSAEIRVGLYNRSTELGFKFPVIVSPHAYVSPHAVIGAGTIVMHGAVINAGAVVGENCIINTRAVIEHEAHVGNHCHISTGVTVNGDVCIGERTFVGSGSIIKEGVTIGKACVVGMGLAVRHRLQDETRFTGGK